MGPTCQACGALNAPTARFCDQCGAAVGAIGASALERRLVTVVFSDVSGYTSIAESLDPEDVGEIMAPIYDAAERLAIEHGGRVAQLLGDGVMAVFGDRLAHEDDAHRAVRYAVALHRAVAELGPDLEARAGSAVALHSGIEAGLVLAGELEAGRTGSGVVGDTVNLAARLEGLAPRGEILLGPETAQLVAAQIDLDDWGAHALKGKREPVQVWHVRRSPGTVTHPSRRLARFAGRERDLDYLLDAIGQLALARSGSVIAVCGEAGAGKSRLLDEARARLPAGVLWLEGRAQSHTANVPFAPLIDLLNRVAGVSDDDSASTLREKLRATVAGAATNEDDALTVLAHLYGADTGTDREAFPHRLLAVLREIMERIASATPTVLCLQDLHWVDPSTIALVRELLESPPAPLVAIVNYRPGFNLAVRGAHELVLDVLSPADVEHMIRSLLDDDEPPPGLAALVDGRAEGNPFFAEEIVNSLIDQHVLERAGDGAWGLTRPADGIEVPTTIRGLLASRIDSLAPDRRRLLREASVVGRRFLYQLLCAVSRDPLSVAPGLVDLEGADLVREAARDPELEYLFKHALVREVAYDGLLKRERQELHERTARALDAARGDRLGELEDTVAYHYQRSGLVSEAVVHLRRAGHRAVERYAIEEARSHYESAYELLTGVSRGPEQDRALLDVLLDWALVHYYQLEFRTLARQLDAHRDLPASVRDEVLRRRWLAWRGHAVWVQEHDVERALTLLDQALDTSLDDDAIATGFAFVWRCWALWHAARSPEVIRSRGTLDRVLERLPDGAERRYIRLKGVAAVATAQATVGDFDAALSTAEEVLGLGSETGNARSTCLGHSVLSLVHLLLGNRDEAISHGRSARDTAIDPCYASYGSLWLTYALVAAGELELAAEEIRRTLPTLAAKDVRAMALPFAGMAALVDLGQGRLSAGLGAVRDVQADAKRRGNHWVESALEVALAVTQARIATGELPADLPHAMRNPRFVVTFAAAAARRAEKRLVGLRARLDRDGLGGFAPIVTMELAKLYAHTGRNEDAGRLARDAVRRIAPAGRSQLRSAAEALLARRAD